MRRMPRATPRFERGSGRPGSRNDLALDPDDRPIRARRAGRRLREEGHVVPVDGARPCRWELASR
jgi:hypothetical protein